MGAEVETGSAVVLSAETSRPVHSTYVLGDKVEVNFHVAGLKPQQAPVTLAIDVVDEREQSVTHADLPVTGDAKGAWDATFEAPAGRLGFYRVRAKLSSGQTIKELGTRKAGYITYAVMADLPSRADYGEANTFYGLQGNFNAKWSDEIVPLLGARWMLEGFGWAGVEPEHAGQFREAIDAGKVSVAPRKAGRWQTYPLICLSPIPKWAAKPDTYMYNTGSLTPEGEKAWVEFCKQAARVNAQRFPNLQQRIYQVTWEPVPPWGFKGTDQELIRIYQLAYPALHEGDPRAVVAGPTRTIENNDLPGTINMLKAGLGKYLDAFAIHPYFSVETEEGGYVTALRTLRAALDQYAKPGLPILGTEQGSPTKEDLSKEIVQAQTLMRFNLIGLGEGMQFNFSFYIHDFRTGGQLGQGFYYNLTPEFAWGPIKIGPKPVAPAFSAQTMLLEGYRPVRAIEWMGATAWGYAYARGDEVALALWDSGPVSQTITLPTGTAEVTVYDMMGNPKKVVTANGELQLALGQDPVYVTGVSPTMWGNAGATRLTLSGSLNAVCPGEEVTVRGHVTAMADAGDLKLVAVAHSQVGDAPFVQSLKASASEATAFEFKLHIPASTLPGRYPLRLVLNKGSDAIAVAGAGLQVVAPVTVSRMEPQLGDNGARSIALTLRNQKSVASRGRVAIALPGLADAEGHGEYAVSAGGTQRVVVPLPQVAVDPLRRYEVVATITPEGGYKVSHARKINFTTAVRMDTADNQGTWAQVPPMVLAGREAVIRGAAQYYKDDKDLSATLRVGWTERALRLHVEIMDDVFCQPFTAADIWKGDSLQLGFNLDPFQKDVKATGNRAADEAVQQRRHTEVNVGLTPQGPQAYRSTTFNNDKLPRGPIPVADWPLSITRSAGKIIYDVEIPWAVLGAKEAPAAGQLIGFGMTVNDLDEPDQKEPKALGGFGGIYPSKNPDKFGLLLLGAGK